MLYAIAAVDREWGIGHNGKLLFSIPDDLKQFKQKTMGTYVIMGRKTFESLPGAKPLPGRDNIVITKSESFETQHPDVIVCHDPHDAAKAAAENPWRDIYVIGGGMIYQQMLPYCHKAFITKVDGHFPADTFFPCLDELPNWKAEKTGEGEWNGYHYEYITYSNTSPETSHEDIL